MKKLLTLVLLFTGISNAFSQTAGDYQTITTGQWNQTSIWKKYDGSSWIAATATPTSADGVITVRNRVTVTAPVTVDQVIVNSGGPSLDIQSTLTVNDGPGIDLASSGNLILNTGGILDGAGLVECLAGLFNWSAGTMQGTGETRLDAGCTASLYGTATKYLDGSRLLTNNGTLTWTAGDINANLAGSPNPAIVNNGTFNISCASTYNMTTTNGGVEFANFTNNGTLNKNSSVVQAIQFRWNVRNPGIINVNSSTLSLSFSSFGSIQSGTYTVASGATLAGGTLNYTGPNFTNNGNVTLTSLTFSGSTTQQLNGLGNITTLRINAGASVVLGNAQTISGVLTNNGTFTIPDGTSLVQTTPSTIAGTGTYIVNRQGHSSASKYNFWSSPITNGNLPGTNGYYYNSALGTHSNSDDNPGPDPGWVSTSGTMTVGKGYASVGGGLASFSGTVNNGTITSAVTTSAQISTSLTAPSYFNLVGNPYPSSISATTFLSANALIDGTVWLWDDDNSGGTGYTSGDYATRTSLGGTAGGGGNTPNGNIGSGQAFFVKANSNGNVTFANDQRGTNNTQFLKTEEEASRIWLSFKNDTLYNELLVGFTTGATDGYDNNYDGYKFRGNPHIAFAAEQEGEEFAIAAFPPATVERIIPLITYVSDEGLYTISNKEEEYMDGMSVYLEDRLLGIFTDISGNGSYSALINEANSANRFYLHFAPLSVTGVQENNPTLVSAYTSAGELTVLFANLEESNATFSIMDMMGKTVYSQPNINLSGNVFRTPVSSLASGVYVIRFNTDNAVYTRKIFIN